jgi:hypothetical protein
MNKVCCRCHERKDESEYDKNKSERDGYSHYCKPCRKIKRKISNGKHKDTISARSCKYYKEHTIEVKQRVTDYYQENKERSNEYHKSWRKAKRISDPGYKILCNTRKRIWDAMHVDGCNKVERTIDLLDCNLNFYKQHLQKTADDRYGKGIFDINNFDGRKWHIDHIIPCAAFNLKCGFHQKLCFNWSNTQILTKKNNLNKSNKIGV